MDVERNRADSTGCGVGRFRLSRKRFYSCTVRFYVQREFLSPARCGSRITQPPAPNVAQTGSCSRLPRVQRLGAQGASAGAIVLVHTKVARNCIRKCST